ncbi:MAG: sensor histidine kinase [Spirochaetales bacterium]|nr:sensor histidine kinase [Spirochaetales bacterium]
MCTGIIQTFEQVKNKEKMTFQLRIYAEHAQQLTLIILLPFLFLMISCEYKELLISMEGEWEYRKGFHESWLTEYESRHWTIINLPFHIKSVPDLKQFQGEITLRKQLPGRIIEELPRGNPMIFRSGRISIAADFYLNTSLLGSLETSEPSRAGTGSELIAYLPSPGMDNGTDTYFIFIVLHQTGTSRFTDFIGDRIETGDPARIYTRVNTDRIFPLFFICFFLFVGIYFINIGVRIPEKQNTLYFGIYCIILSVYYFIYYPAHQLMIINDHLVRYKLIHCILFLSGPVFLLFIYNMYIKKLPLVLKIWSGLCIVCSLMSLFAGSFFIDILYYMWSLSWMILLIHFLFIIIQEIARNNIEAILMITGMVILITGSILDFLINAGYFMSPPVGLFTSFLTLIIITTSISNRYIRVNAKVEKLNVELEKRVKERTQKLEQTQVKLIDTAHKAGMAEVATTILHNMRNILNSISISCEEIIDTLQSSKLEGLLKANMLLEKHKDDIAAFFTSDPKGKLLIEYYISVSELLIHEHNKVMLETEHVRKNLKMIQKIINTQQEYAKRELVDNELNLEDTIEEALTIQNKEFTQAHIKVQKNYLKVIYIKGQKSSIIQILLNIFKNACTAMEENDYSDRILTIETGSAKGKKAYARITDNGKGIPEEDLGKIFQFGFTRQEDGHGFGLHACADIINKMGGTITVQSNGPGRGAAFTLFFPLINIK